MHRIDENYSFVAHKKLGPIVEWLTKKQPLIAFSGETIDKPVLLSSRKILAGIIEMSHELMKLATGKTATLPLPIKQL
jgi:hypothetical protein